MNTLLHITFTYLFKNFNVATRKFKLHIWLLNYIFLLERAALDGRINHVSEIDCIFRS